MTGLGARASREQRRIGPLLVAAVVLGLAGLPVALWLDLSALSERMLRAQAAETGRIIDAVRAFYAEEIVRAVLGAHGPVSVTHNFRGTPDAIPIPATLSIELGKLISGRDAAVRYRFFSDLPFAGRAPHEIDAFERRALDSFRRDAKASVSEVSGSLFDRKVRVATPILLGQVCVDCHNTHPDSPRRDWRVGDVRGLQELTIHQPIAGNVFTFKYLLAYFVLAASAGVLFILLQRRQAALIQGMNAELTEANGFLAAISMKIAKYLPPQIYKSIFSGEKDVAITTERKKLTIFFSDIQDFTSTTEQLQPEELTLLLNEYLTEMSAIAAEHGATVDKFIGDAILAFFGDPETKGAAEDARACLRMAIAMQRRLEQLNLRWQRRGVQRPFRVRMGINTGYCNVGNFGSEDRMQYTIIGAEANLAARLQSIAQPGGIVLSYETYSLVRGLVRARPLEPISMKGISREVEPYVVEGVVGEEGRDARVISEQAAGLDLFLDLETLDDQTAERARRKLAEALEALDSRPAPPASVPTG